MYKLLTLAAGLLITVGCQTTSQESTLTAMESANIEGCAGGDSQQCIRAALDASRARHFSAADRFAEEACNLGNSKGCMLAQDLLRHPARNRAQPSVDSQAMMKVFLDSADKIGTVEQPRKQTRCVTRWNDWMRQQETVCE